MSSLIDLCVQALCQCVHAGRLDVGTAELPLELISRLVINVCQHGLLEAQQFKQYLRPHFCQITIPGCILADDNVVRVISETCPLLRIVNCTPALIDPNNWLANTDRSLLVSRCAQITFSSLQSLVLRCLHLENLSIGGCYRVTDEVLTTLPTAASGGSENDSTTLTMPLQKLTSLDISFTRMTDDSLRAAGNICSLLTSLSISGLAISTDAICSVMEKCTGLISLSTEECRQLQAPFLSTAGRFCPNLETVLVSGCFLLKDAEVEALVSNCKYLSCLSLRECNQLRDGSLIALAKFGGGHLRHLDLCWTGIRTSLAELAGCSRISTSLEGLHLSWCQLMDEPSVRSVRHFCAITELNLSWRTVSDENFDVIITSLSNLTDLDITGCTELSPNAFFPFDRRQGNDKLLSLSAAWCRGIDDAALTTIVSNCRKLVSIDLAICSRISDVGVQQISMSCTNLRRLILSRCDQLSDDAFDTLTRCPNLQTLSFADIKISDFKIFDIVAACRSLRALVLSGCNCLTNMGIEAISMSLEVVKVISLSGCTLVQDDAIQMLAMKHGRYLHTLNVCQTSITDSAVGAVSQYCVVLQALHLSFCEEITDVGLDAVSERLHRTLQTLHVSCCTRLTEAALERAVERCSLLTDLNINSLFDASTVFVQTVCTKASYLSRLDISNCNRISFDDAKRLKQRFSANGRKFQLLSSYMLALE